MLARELKLLDPISHLDGILVLPQLLQHRVIINSHLDQFTYSVKLWKDFYLLLHLK